MREIKRKRPWETEPKAIQTHPLDTFLHQLVLCAFITIGILIAFNTQNNNHIKQIISKEITKTIHLQDIESLVSDIKQTFNQVIDSSTVSDAESITD